ncbi:MAG TPA: DUF2442 domain-containing protein [Steroidobacteraceae bacterium]|nr:DUF2442 domain-containing protein [Steroidobacteraceae bacterium]
MKLKIERVEALPPARLRLEWANGRQSEVSVREYLRSRGHERLRDATFFSQARVEEWGHGVEWPGVDIGIPAEALFRLSKEQSGDAFPTSNFNAWMKRNALSLSAAAEALHLTRRTIIYYSTGAKPIPAYIGLACTGWEVTQRPRANAARRSASLHAARRSRSRSR